MLFKRYDDVLMRLEEIGALMGNLSNGQRQELQSLLEEQAWLSMTLVKQAKSTLEDIDKSFEQLFNWMVVCSDLIDRASNRGGTPEDILRLQKVMDEASSLKEQLRNLSPESVESQSEPVLPPEEERQVWGEARSEAAPAAALPAAGLLQAEPPKRVTPVKKKIRKKKLRKGNNDNDVNYKPPLELLSTLTEKMAPRVRRFANVLESNAVSGSFLLGADVGGKPATGKK